MEVLDALNEVKQLNKRHASVNHDSLLLKTLKKFEDVTGEQAIEAKMQSFLEKKKFKRLEDSDGDDQMTEIDDPYSLMTTQDNNKLVDYSSVDEADESSDSDIDIVQKTKQHRIDPLAFISLGKR